MRGRGGVDPLRLIPWSRPHAPEAGAKAPDPEIDPVNRIEATPSKITIHLGEKVAVEGAPST